MKRLILLSLLLANLYSSAQLFQCTHETFYTDDGAVLGYPEGYTTYRIYIDLEDPADFLSAVFAAGNDLLTLGSSTNNIWNDTFGVVTGEALNPALFVPFPSAEYDSFVTIGRASSADPGGAVTAIVTLPDPNAIINSMGVAPGPNLSFSDGAWFTPNGNINGNGIDQGGPGPYRVLIAQITTDGDPEYMLNVQIFDEGDGTDGAMFYVGNPESVDGEDINGFPLGLTYPANNCDDPGACNYNNFPEGTDDPDACEYVTCAGCTDIDACIYDPEATIDDGSCIYPDGCTDEDADNYNPDAECDDGTCVYGGCMNPLSCNYDPDATVDDGSCTDVCPGCTDPDALNYDENATEDDGSCTDSPIVDAYFETVITHTEPTEDGVDLTGQTTYRLYVEMANDQQFLSSIFGVDDTPLLLTTTTSFYQSQFGASTGDMIIPELYEPFPSLAFDSWVTIGREDNDSPGGLIITAGNPEFPWENLFEQGESIAVVDDLIGATWFTNFDNENGFPDEDNKVLVAQVTTDGEVGFCFGVQVFVDGDQQNDLLTFVCGGNESLAGCMDSEACNYQSWVTEDDGSCIYPDGCTNPNADNYDPDALCDDGSCTCGDGSEFVYITMTDSFGDGWGGAIWTISNDLEEIIESGTLDDGGYEELDFCLQDGCYVFSVSGGNFPTEIGWDIEGSFGTYSGGSPGSAAFSLGDDCIVGCLDPSSCNYIEDADISFGCDYACIGCVDPAACNYEDDNTIDDGSCLYYAVVQGYVFNDANQDGIFDTWFFGEPGLVNTAVIIEELEMVTYTNGDGYFEFFNVPAGTYTISLVDVPEGWVTTTDQSLTITTSNCLVEDIVFGLTAEDSPPFWIGGPCCIFMMDIHCDFGFNPGLWVNNTGSTPLNGTITVAYDEVLEAEALWGAVEPTTIEPGLSTWTLDDSPMGGQSLLYQIHILGPGPDYIGQEFPIDITLSLEDDEGIEYYNNTWTLYPIVVCAYDPNDKYAADDGYSEEHFVLAEDEIEYRIRFQNTGNFPATDVVIKDTLDLDRLDLDTFYPVFGSHSFMTCVQPDGAVEFVFNEIMLPDSAADEPGSQGYVVYRIKSLPEIEPGEVINNTAHIFFDLNPAVVTNTTWHTIYECGSEALFEVSTDELCAFEELTASGTHTWTETYDWSVDGMDFGTDDSWSDSFEPGDYDIMLTASNPICDPVTETQTVTVNPLPTADITENGVELTAPTADSYQWYFEGELIDGATDQQFIVEEEGWYSVEITNEFGCSDLSDEVFVMVTGIGENQGSSLVVFPNPMTNSSTLLLDSSAQRVDIIDGRGRIVQSYNQIFNDRLIISKSDMTPGQYIIRVVSNNATQEINLLVK